jgi:regulator of replication initiation timing
MISKRDRMVSSLKKEILLLKKQLDNLSETNAKLKTENEFYAEETAKKDKIING